AGAPGDGAGTVELVPARGPQPAGVHRHLLGEGVGLPQGDPARLPHPGAALAGDAAGAPLTCPVTPEAIGLQGGPRRGARKQQGRFAMRAARILTPIIPWASCLALAWGVSQAGAQPSRVPDLGWLRKDLEQVRSKYKLPALAASVVIDDRVVAASAVGVRVAGGTLAVRQNDHFHLGSIAKPMTATLIGVLVDEKKLRWDSTLARMFPELLKSMNAAYRPVTITQLLSHTSGMPYQPSTPESVTDGRARTLPGKRLEYTKAAVLDAPE